MKLAEQLTTYVNAAYSGIWLTTQEPDEAEREIIQLRRAARNGKIAVWDVANGFCGSPARTPVPLPMPAPGDPLQPPFALFPRWRKPTAPPSSFCTTSIAS